MNDKTRIKLDADADASLVTAVEDLAEQEGLKLDALLDEALSDLLAKHGQPREDGDAMSVYQASHDKYAELYKKLAR